MPFCSITRADLLGPLGGAGKAAALVERLGRGRELCRKLKWPGGTLEIELQVLTRAKTAEAHAAAFEASARRGVSPDATGAIAAEERADEVMSQILARAVLDPETHAPLFASSTVLAEVATDDELVTLFNAYSELRYEVDPDPQEMDAEEVQAIDEILKKKDPTRLNDIVSSMRRGSLRSLVCRLVTSLVASSSSTPVPSDTPSPASPTE